MKSLVATNIRQALDATNAAPQFPSFHRLEDGRVECDDGDQFGFYALAAACRAVLVGTRFLQAGDVLQASEFHAASIVCYYTSGLNMVLSFLALHGRAYVDSPWGPLRENPDPSSPMREKLWPDEASLLAVLSARNRWTFEKRSRTHAARWEEVRRAFEEEGQLPAPFFDLFEYVLSYGPHQFGGAYRGHDYLTELVHRGSKAVREVRHEAVYKGFGFDEFAVDLIVNDEGGGNWCGLGLKGEAFRRFCVEMGEMQIQEIVGFLDELAPDRWKVWHPSLFMAVFTPEFEVGWQAVTGAEVYSHDLQRLRRLLMPTRHAGPD